MEILFVSHKYPPATGGMEKQSFELINGMKRLTGVHALVLQPGESRVRFFWMLQKRIRLILKENPNIRFIHFNDGLIAAYGLILRDFPRIQRIVTLHGLDVVFPSYLYQRFIFPRFESFDLIVAVSRATANACETRGISPEKIVVIPNGVDEGPVSALTRAEVDDLLSDRYKVRSQGKKILVAIGRPVKRKGFSWFMEHVMPLLHRDFILLMIGPISRRKRRVSGLDLFPKFLRRKLELFLGAPNDEFAIEKLMKKERSGRVNRLGKLPREEIQAILGVADAFIMPNIDVEGDMEGFGLVCLEASVCGTKVFASASGGISDAIVDGKNGILIPPGDERSWTKHLNQLIDDPDSIPLNENEISTFTREHFSWKKMCAEYLFHFYRIS